MCCSFWEKNNGFIDVEINCGDFCLKFPFRGLDLLMDQVQFSRLSLKPSYSKRHSKFIELTIK